MNFVLPMEDKYKLLFLSSFILLSFSYVYDLPATLNEHINYCNENKASRLALLYSVYALPNIIIPLFFRWTTSVDLPMISEILCFLVLLGQVLYSIGVFKMNYSVMLIGRIIYGLGGESFSVIINRLLSKEFKGKDLAFTLGLFSSITRIGAILNFSSSPILAEKVHRLIPCLIGIFLTSISALFCLIINDVLNSQKASSYMMIERKKKANTKSIKTVNFNEMDLKSVEFQKKNEKERSEVNKETEFINHTHTNENSHSVDYSQIFYQVDFNQSPFTPWESVNKDYTSEISGYLEISEPKELIMKENMIFYEPSIKTEKTYHSTFILLATISFLIALIWAPFYSLAPILFKSRYNMNSVESGHLLSVIEILGLFLTPFVGTLADKYGQKIYFILAGCILLFIAHIFLALQVYSPYFVVGILGAAGPLVNCYWPCIPNLVSENNLTNGFAIIFCLLNLAFTFSPIIMGFLISRMETFTYVEIFILGISVTVSLVIGLLIYLNRKFNLGLNLKAEKYELN